MKAHTRFGVTVLKPGVYYILHEVNAVSLGVAFQ
jgi:hypothetical protein